MAISERLALLVTLDAQGAIKSFNDIGKAADKNLGKADQKLDKMASRFQKAGAGMLATAGLASVALFKAGQAAGDLEQALGGTEAVFGEASAAIDEYAKKAAQAAGLSESAFRTATTSIGGQLKGLGFTVDEAADQAIKLTQVAADLSATYGGTTAEAVAALGAAFRGEADPAERFNLFLNQTRVNAKAVELGLAASTSSVDAHAKAQATLALIAEQSADAQGQFARESDTAQGAMARFSAASENLKAAVGGAVAPVLADVADAVGGLVQRFNDLPAPTQQAISRFALLGTGALGAAGALSFTVGKVIDMRENLSPLTARLKNAEGGFNRFGKSLVGLGLVGTVAGLAATANEMNKLHVEVDELANALGNMNTENRKALDEFVTGTIAMGVFDDAVEQTAETNAVAADRLIDYAKANGLAATEVARLRGIVEDKRRVDAQATIDQSANAAAVDETVEALGGVPAAAGAAADASDEMTSAVDRQKAALDLASESMDLFKQGIEDAFGDLTIEEAADRRAQAFEDMSSRFADAQRAVKDAKQRVSDLLAMPIEDRSDTFGRDLAAAQKEVQDAIAETSRALEGNSEIALQNREDIRGAVDDIAAVIQAHRDEGASLEDLQAIRYLEQENLRIQLEKMGFNREEIGRYIDAINDIPITKATTITVDSAPAQLRIKELADSLQALAPDQQLSIDAAVIDRNLQRASTRRAIGGPVTAGMPYSTNEYLGAGKGFEWFAPANGTISPAGGSLAPNSYDYQVTIVNPVAEPASQSLRSLRRVSLEMAG